MVLLLLNGRCYILRNGDDSVVVSMSNGWCAAITIDPERPLEKWRRICLGHEPTEFEDAQRVFKTLAVGLYEAHTNSKTGTPLVVYFEITDTGELEILGTRGDEDLVLANLNRLTLDELRNVREAELESDGFPPVEGAFQQREWPSRFEPI